MVHNEYKATLGRTARFITIGILLFLAFLVFRVIDSAEGIPYREWPALAVALVILVMTPLVSFLYSPKAYILTDDMLLIKRHLRPRIMPLYKIREVRMLDIDILSGSARFFGVGGLFGYFGRFYIPQVGMVSFFATSNRNPILIITHKNKKYLITPDDPAMFHELQEAVRKFNVGIR